MEPDVLAEKEARQRQELAELEAALTSRTRKIEEAGIKEPPPEELNQMERDVLAKEQSRVGKHAENQKPAISDPKGRVDEVANDQSIVASEANERQGLEGASRGARKEGDQVDADNGSLLSKNIEAHGGVAAVGVGISTKVDLKSSKEGASALVENDTQFANELFAQMNTERGGAQVFARVLGSCKGNEGKNKSPASNNVPSFENQPSSTEQIPQGPGAFHVGAPDPLPNEECETEVAEVTSESGHEMALSFPATVVEEPQDVDIECNSTHSSADTPPQSTPPTREGLTVDAIPFKETSQSYSRSTALHLWAVALLLGVVIVLLALGLSGAFQPTTSATSGNDNSKDASTSTLTIGDNDTMLTKSTLEMIREEGVLKCDYSELPPQHQGIRMFMSTMCEAVAAAIFGVPKVKYVHKEHPGRVQFQELVDKRVDLMTFGYIFTMGRNVFETRYGTGFDFSFPYLYEGMKIAGDTFYVESCVDKNLKHIDECAEMRICVGEGSPYHNILAARVPRRNLHVMERNGLYVFGLANGTCNLFTGSSSFMQNNETIRATGYTGDFAVSKSHFSKEPLAIVTRNDDPEWSDFVNSVLVALQVAEKLNITKDTASMFPQTNLFGDDYKDMFRRAIGHAGNLGELHQRFLQYQGGRGALNQLNNGTTGLLYSLPYGTINAEPEDDVLSDKVSGILSRKQIRCGVRLGRQGFATKSVNNMTASSNDIYRGIEIDYCIALAASMFRGGTERDVLFVDLSDQTDGFQKLASGEIDVFAGATWTLENDVREPSTQLGFSFSPPYFYGYSEDEDNLSMATRQESHDWSTFVYWIVSSIIYAEERGIDQPSSNSMPEMLLFGSSFNRMFRDAIFAVGSYKSLYERNLQHIIPRGSRNMLNDNSNPGGQHYVFPGVLGQ